MKIEIINTGTELLIGDVINTNVAWMGRWLVELGLQVERSTCVPDGAAIETALEEACRRVDVVMVTGGLGPTSDDVSREAAAAVFGVELGIDEDVLVEMTAYFAQRGMPVNAHNKRQAMVPRGATVLPNAHGTAPGLFLPASLGAAAGLQCAVFLLPGPPRELQPMIRTQVEPILRGMLPAGHRRRCQYFKFTGIGESNISMALQDGLDEIGVETGYCLGNGDVDVRVAGTEAELARVAVFCREKLGEFLVSDDRRVVEEVVVHRLTELGQWVATAESCTGGFIASRLTDVSGSSHVFAHGLVTYSNAAKTQHLGVPAAMIEAHGAVSEPVAAAMAEGCLRVSGADHAIAVTGIAGRGGGTEQKPSGTVFIALASKGHPVAVRKRWFAGERARFKMHTSQTALDFIRRRLSGYELPV